MKRHIALLLLLGACSQPQRQVHPCEAWQQLRYQQGASFNSWYIWQFSQMCARMVAQPPSLMGDLLMTDNPRLTPYTRSWQGMPTRPYRPPQAPPEGT